MWEDLLSEDRLVSAPILTASLGVWADYCELLCISSESKKIDQDEIISIIIKSYDFQIEEKNNQTKGRKEKLTSILEDVYGHIYLRNNILSERYPFMINTDGQLCYKTDSLSKLQTLYVLLLLSSNLRYIKKCHPLTSDFEVICLLYMKQLFTSMDFKLFGSSNTNRLLSEKNYISDSKLKERILKLSEFISVPYDKEDVERLSDYDHGDGGLDIVGIRNMGDNRMSVPVMYGQCACSREEWSQKQFSLSDTQWGKFLKIWSTSIQKYIFIPYWYMNSEKQFENELKITSCVLVDRLRLMNLADESFASYCCSLIEEDK